MGVDVYSHSGVAIPLKRLTKIITEENRVFAIRAILRYTTFLLHSLRIKNELKNFSEWEIQTRKSNASVLLSHFRSLSNRSTVQDIRQLLEDLTPQPDVEGCSIVRNLPVALAVWAELISELHPTAPKPINVDFVENPRHQGGALPPGEVVFIFSEADCFERIKTKAGRALDLMVGYRTEVSTWTDYSF
jgi:hypothetical protein